MTKSYTTEDTEDTELEGEKPKTSVLSVCSVVQLFLRD